MTGSLMAVKWLLACAPAPAALTHTPALHGGDPAAWVGASRDNGLAAGIARYADYGVSRDRVVRPPSLPSRVLPDAVGAATLRRATYSDDVGDALNERMRDFSPAQVQNYSVSLLSAAELFGEGETPGLCEMPIIEADAGDGYEAGLAVYTYTAILNDPEPMFVSISPGCAAAVAERSGQVEAAVDAGDCAEDEAQTFFAPGSDCRACVEDSGGDYAGCLDEGACPVEAPLAVWVADEDGVRTWYRSAAATGWACAPGWLAPFYLLSTMGEDGQLPRAFDHDSWAFLCTPFWDEAAGAPTMACQGSNEPGERGVLAEGLFGFVSYLRPQGEEQMGWRGRQYYVDSIQFSTGADLSWSWAYAGGLGRVSAPRVIADTNGSGGVDPGDDDYGYGAGGMGFDPHQTRPDGELMARDWLAAVTLKTATTRDGVPILPYQRSRCESWVEEGDHWRCEALGQPEDGWINDAYTTWADTDRSVAVSFPLATLASTGLPDEDVPGGLVTDIAGSPGLANPAWDDCALPHRFTPDTVRLPDLPGQGDGALVGQSWRFDRPDGPDYRVVLNTNQARGWCGGDAEGGGRSGLDLE